MAALTFPLAAATLAARLCVDRVNFRLPEARQISRTAAGQIIADTLADRLWTGQIVTYGLTAADARALAALLAVLTEPGRSVFIGNPHYRGPRNDPGGVVLGAASPTINAISTDRREIAIQGLPAAYVISAGDYLSFSHGDPARQAFHQVVTGATASAGGLAQNIEVIPAIREGGVTGLAVELKAPVCKAVLEPGAAMGIDQNTRWAAPLSFGFIQTLR